MANEFGSGASSTTHKVRWAPPYTPADDSWEDEENVSRDLINEHYPEPIVQRATASRRRKEPNEAEARAVLRDGCR